MADLIVKAGAERRVGGQLLDDAGRPLPLTDSAIRSVIRGRFGPPHALTVVATDPAVGLFEIVFDLPADWPPGDYRWDIELRGARVDLYPADSNLTVTVITSPTAQQTAQQGDA